MRSKFQFISILILLLNLVSFAELDRPYLLKTKDKQAYFEVNELCYKADDVYIRTEQNFIKVPIDDVDSIEVLTLNSKRTLYMMTGGVSASALVLSIAYFYPPKTMEGVFYLLLGNATAMLAGYVSGYNIYEYVHPEAILFSKDIEPIKEKYKCDDQVLSENTYLTRAELLNKINDIRKNMSKNIFEFRGNLDVTRYLIDDESIKTRSNYLGELRYYRNVSDIEAAERLTSIDLYSGIQMRSDKKIGYSFGVQLENALRARADHFFVSPIAGVAWLDNDFKWTYGVNTKFIYQSFGVGLGYEATSNKEVFMNSNLYFFL